MTDWLYEASNAQANLEEARRQLAENERLLDEYRRTLHLIATDLIELSHDKIRSQRDYFMQISRKALGLDKVTLKGESNVKIADDF